MNGRGSRRAGTRAAPPPAVILPVLAAAAAAVTVAVALFVLHSAPPHARGAAALVHALQVAVPAAVALAALARSPTDRFARALLAVGLLCSTTALAESADPTLYSLGRNAVWLVEPALVFLFLAFPSGRLTGVAARRTLIASVLVVGLLWVPTIPIAASYPVPSAWAVTCGLHCPANALAVTSAEPGVVDLLRPVREVLSALVMLVTAVLLVRRRRIAGPLLRIALLPVVALAVYRAAALGAYFVVRAVDRGAPALDAAGWVYLLSLPLVALAFGAGLVLRDARASPAIQRLALGFGPEATASELRRGLSQALDDPSLRLLSLRSAAGAQWVDETGAAATPPDVASGRTAVVVRTAEGQAAALVVDEALGQDPAILRAAATYALVLLENGRLVGRLRTSLGDLAQSRSRAIAIADETRRRIERDLHDGAQQRLIGLRIRLSIESEALERVDPRAAEVIAGLGADVEHALDELRALAHGVYPSVLTDRGLPDALRA